MFYFFPAFDANELKCFVHQLSPMKRGNDGQSNYFYCKLQTSTAVIKAVCFSSDKRILFNDLVEKKTPICLNDFDVNNKYGITNIVINKKSKVTNSPEVNFQRVDIETATV